ncbi:MAG: hypothetical protein RLN75_05975, partial [Longimicrobiales bacterium]
LTHLDKTYEAEALLGVTTDTLDHEGEVQEVRPGAEAVDDASLEAAAAALRGPQDQLPPVYSAKKIGGEAAHRRVRRGESVTLAPVSIHVHALDLLEREGARVRFRVRCSSGTYVRALARDLGEAVGVGAHLTALRRTAVGAFSVGGAIPIDALDAVPPEAWITPADALRRAGVPSFEVGPDDPALLAQGRVVSCGDALSVGPATPVAAVREGRLLAIGELEGGRFQPRRVFVSS